MKPESRLDQILPAVLARPPAERESYLDEVCAGDEELRRKILAALVSHRDGFATNPMPPPNIPGPELTHGDFVGPYRIERILGRGGMGDVYLAEHMGQAREVALKILPEDFVGEAQRVQRFRQEARAVMTLNHPNIVTVYDIGAAESGYFISTEFVEGETLRSRLNHDRLNTLAAIEIAEQVAGALAYAHEKGVIHRDIKPENIMLRPDGYVKVLDFGLAKLTEPDAPAATDDSQRASILTLMDTSPGIVMGTVQYMSPEQACGLVVDGRTDIWSLGAVLYEMIAGRPAFEALSRNQIVAAILNQEPLPLIRFAPEIPPELERIITRALCKDRNERYQVTKDLLLDLKSVRQEMELAAKLQRSGLRDPAFDNENPPVTTSPGFTRAPISTRQSTAGEIFPGWTSRLKSLIGLLVLVGLAIVFYKVVLQRSVSNSAFSSIQIARLTSTGKSRLAAISPDGKYVVDVAEEAGKEGLWIRQVATTNNVQIVASAEVEFQGLTFSPDGNFVYFVAHEKAKSIRDLYQVSALGGATRKLISNVDTAVTFSPDGKRIGYVRRLSDRAEDALMVANADGSDEQKLLTRKQPDFFSMSGPAWSPDGKLIAAGAGGSDKDGRYMTVIGVEVASGIEKPLTSRRWTGVGRVAWRGPLGSDLMINALEQSLGLYQIWLIALPEGDARRITNDLSDYRDLSLTQDASILAVTQSDQLSSLWSFAAASAESARQITSGKYDGYYGVDWRPEGQVIYSSSNGSNHDIWQADAVGSNQRQLTAEARSNVWPTVSPDGRYIVFGNYLLDARLVTC